MTEAITPPAASAAPASSEEARGQRYECAGVSFALPRDWEDVTTFVARAPGAESSTPLILKVARDRMAPSDTLSTHAGQVIVKLGKQIPGFVLQEASNVEAAGRPGVIFRFRLAMDAGMFEQYLVLLDPLDDPERRVSVLNISGPETEAARMCEVLRNILQSLDVPGRPSESSSKASRPTASSAPTTVPPPPPPPGVDYGVPMPGLRGR